MANAKRSQKILEMQVFKLAALIDFQRALETSSGTLDIANKYIERCNSAAGIATATTTDELKAQWDSTI